jgi:Fe-S cluster assembly protein SufD
VTASYLSEFEAFSANGADEASGEASKWVAPIRQQAIGRFRELGFPTPKNEDWHFTSVAPIAERNFRPGSAGVHSVRAENIQRALLGHPEWPLLVFVNGRYDSKLSRPGAMPEGVKVLPLSEAWKAGGDTLQAHLTRMAAFEEESFTALNTAFMWDGAVIHVQKDTVLDAPIHLLFVADGSAAEVVTHPRTLIVAERHSRVQVIESFIAADETTYFTNAVTEIAVGEGASVDHYRLQRESKAAYHVGTVEAYQARDSRFRSFSFATGAALSRMNIRTVLAGEGSEVWMDGLYMADGQQHVDHQTRIEHVAPNCASHEVYKGILDGASHGVFNGKVYVHPEAQKTDGKQTNNNLLLSERAHVDTKPQLEIFADDVKCTHGATVGRLDEVALFYMKSRGIDRVTARELLTYAFAAEVLERIPLDALRIELEAQAMKRFTHAT